VDESVVDFHGVSLSAIVKAGAMTSYGEFIHTTSCGCFHVQLLATQQGWLRFCLRVPGSFDNLRYFGTEIEMNRELLARACLVSTMTSPIIHRQINSTAAARIFDVNNINNYLNSICRCICFHKNTKYHTTSSSQAILLSTMSDHRNTGPWSQEEKEWFQKGIDQFGVDYGKLEDHMGGARNRKQIKFYYHTNIKKDPDIFSPGKSPKKRTTSQAENEDASTPMKKSKAGGKEARTPAASAKKATRSASASTVKASARKLQPPEESDEESEEEIKPPPPVPKTTVTKTSAKKTSVPTKRTTRSATAAAKPEESSKEKEMEEQASLTSFFNKEEVQVVLAGFLGFLVVMFVKMLMA
jgi:hypothetical protein